MTNFAAKQGGEIGCGKIELHKGALLLLAKHGARIITWPLAAANQSSFLVVGYNGIVKPAIKYAASNAALMRSFCIFKVRARNRDYGRF